eukprot:PhF_6_TR25346/c0_g1_i1/m.35069
MGSILAPQKNVKGWRKKLEAWYSKSDREFRELQMTLGMVLEPAKYQNIVPSHRNPFGTSALQTTRLLTSQFQSFTLPKLMTKIPPTDRRDENFFPKGVTQAFTPPSITMQMIMAQRREAELNDDDDSDAENTKEPKENNDITFQVSSRVRRVLKLLPSKADVLRYNEVPRPEFLVELLRRTSELPRCPVEMKRGREVQEEMPGRKR